MYGLELGQDDDMGVEVCLQLIDTLHHLVDAHDSMRQLLDDTVDYMGVLEALLSRGGPFYDVQDGVPDMVGWASVDTLQVKTCGPMMPALYRIG